MDLTDRFRKNEGIIFKEEGEGGFLFDPETGNLKYMNPSGKETFLVLMDQKDVEEMIKHLLRVYPDADPKQVQRDLEGFLTELDKNGFISPLDVT